MPSSITYGYGAIKHITSGLLTKRYYNAPSRYFLLSNIVRLLQENQAFALAEQTITDGWVTFPLTIIPDNRFHIGIGKDFNDLSCNLLYTSKNDNQDNSVTRQLEVQLLVTLEAGVDPYDCYRRADSYITAFEGILETYFKVAPQELSYDTTTGRFLNIGATAEIIGTDLVVASNLPNINKSIGFLPNLKIRLEFTPSNKQT